MLLPEAKKAKNMMNSNPFLIESYIIQYYGVRGTGKTTAALAGPGRKAYMEIDIGSLQRAASSMQFAWEDIDYHKYQLPPTSLRDRGRVSTDKIGQSGKGAATVVHDLRGWDDLGFRFTNEFCDFCEDYRWVEVDGKRIKIKADEPYRDIIIDTGTLLWDLLQDATRERIFRTVPQDQQEKELKRLEFEEPNTQIWEMCNYAKSNKKNLIFTSMEGWKWINSGPSPGYDYDQHRPEGNKRLPGYVDVEVRMTVESNVPVGQLVKVAAGGLELLNMKIPNPTTQKIITVLDGASYLKREGIDIPRGITYDNLMGMVS